MFIARFRPTVISAVVRVWPVAVGAFLSLIGRLMTFVLVLTATFPIVACIASLLIKECTGLILGSRDAGNGSNARILSMCALVLPRWGLRVPGEV